MICIEGLARMVWRMAAPARHAPGNALTAWCPGLLRLACVVLACVVPACVVLACLVPAGARAHAADALAFADATQAVAAAAPVAADRHGAAQHRPHADVQSPAGCAHGPDVVGHCPCALPSTGLAAIGPDGVHQRADRPIVRLLGWQRPPETPPPIGD